MTSTLRELLKDLSLSSAAVLLSTETHAMNRPQDKPQGGAGDLAPAYAGPHALVPLPFDPQKLRRHLRMDYGAAAAEYIDAFFQNVHGEEIERRFERAMKAAQALQG